MKNLKSLKLRCPNCKDGNLIYCAVPEKPGHFGYPGNMPAKLGVCCDSCRMVFNENEIGILVPWLVERMTEIKNMLQAVYEMRQAQKDYFQQKTDRRLKIALAKEKNVDDILFLFIKEGSIIVNYKPGSDQGTLFKR